MSGPADGRLPATQPPPKRQPVGGGAGSAFPLAGCLVFMPHASQLSAAGIDPSSWIVGIPRLGGSLTHNHWRAASVTHALVPTVAPPGGGGTSWAWLPAELLPGSTVAAPGLHYVIPAWAADCIAWKERRPEVGYTPAERYNGVPPAATAASTVMVPAAAAAAAAHGTTAMPKPAAAAPAARRGSHAAPASTAAQRTDSAAAAAAAHAPAAAHGALAAAARAVGVAAPPSDLVQASFDCLITEAVALDLRVLLSVSRASAASLPCCSSAATPRAAWAACWA